MRRIVAIAAREALEGFRNKWAAAAALLLAALALTLGFLGSAPVGGVNASPLDVEIVSLSSLTILLLPLIALVVSHDAIAGEAERGTLALVLATPVARWEAIVGKFLGHMFLLALATIAGFGIAAAALWASAAEIDANGWRSLAAMIALSVLLGAVFVALGYVASAWARDRATAAAIAVGLWLLFAILFDMALLGLLVADRGRHLDATAVAALLFLNPCDLYRLLTIGDATGAARFSGMSSLAANASPSPHWLLAGLVAWVLVPLWLAIRLLERRDI
ncbi:ABC transporter permease subunit [Methylocystis parvus]|uniref:ABC transporter permease subunit n=1 Tax=Methylocystis parvus TaxID=134 RepID=UPI003C754708